MATVVRQAPGSVPAAARSLARERRAGAMNPARIDRALAILGYLAQHQEGCTLKRLCDDLPLPMSSAHDLMQTLVEIGAARVRR